MRLLIMRLYDGRISVQYDQSPVSGDFRRLRIHFTRLLNHRMIATTDCLNRTQVAGLFWMGESRFSTQWTDPGDDRITVWGRVHIQIKRIHRRYATQKSAALRRP